MSKDAQLPTLEEMRASCERWTNDRVQQTNSLGGINGIDLRDQRTLLTIVGGLTDDVTYLLGYVKALTEQIEVCRAKDGDAKQN